MSIPSLDELPSGAEVVVIGGGVVGASTAFWAARAGFRPLLLERRPALCSVTTAAAAGGYRLQQDNEEELRLVRESVDLFESFAEVTGQDRYDLALRAQGYLWVTTTDEGAGRQRDLVAMQTSWGVDDVEVLDGDEARKGFPYLSPEVRHARFRARDGLLDPKGLTFGLAAGAVDSGAGIALGTTVTGIEPAGGRAKRVRTDRGDVDADAVVVAAGPFSGEVTALAGVDLPVQTVLRHKVVLPDIPGVPPDAPMTIDEDSGAHWRPSFGGASLLFTDPETPPSPPRDAPTLDPGFAFRLLDPDSPVSVARVAPFWREVWEDGSAQWMLQGGHYTMTPDRRPLIGETELEGLFVNTGYCGHGVMASPAGSRRLADVLAGRGDAEAAAYSPGRAFEARPNLDPL